MPPLPVIAGVYRIAYLWVGGGVNPVNVHHYRISGATPTLQTIATNLGNAHAAGAHGGFEALSSLYNCSAVQITPLDGVTAGQVLGLGRTLTGSATGEQIYNAAAVLSQHTAQRGPRGRGRSYIGPITESVTANGILDATVGANMLSGWNSVHTAMLGSTPPATPVVASYKHADAHDVTGIRIDNYVGSMRRRLDKLAGR